MVVIAIISVLACILVPQMAGYIEQAKITRANANAKLVYTYANEYMIKVIMKGEMANDVGGTVKCPLTKDKSGDPVTYTGDKTDLKRYLSEKFDTGIASDNSNNEPFALVSYDETGVIESTTWASKRADRFVGSYPTPAVGKSSKIKSSARTKYYEPNLGENE